MLSFVRGSSFGARPNTYRGGLLSYMMVSHTLIITVVQDGHVILTMDALMPGGRDWPKAGLTWKSCAVSALVAIRQVKVRRSVEAFLCPDVDNKVLGGREGQPPRSKW